MSSLVSTPEVEATRRALSARQVATLEKLLAAAVDELRENGFERLSVRSVASRAGVAPATAYNYFSSKEHLVTEVFWRRLAALPETSFAAGEVPAERVSETMADLALLVSDEPELAAACTVAMLSTESDVKLLRDRIGIEMSRRIAKALGDKADSSVLRALEFTISGAMLQAGMGHLTYEDLAGLLRSSVRLIVPETSTKLESGDDDRKAPRGVRGGSK